MAAKVTASFKFTPQLHYLLNHLGTETRTSKTRVLADSVVDTSGLLGDALEQTHSDLGVIAERYGSHARIVIAVELEGERPIGKLLINGEPPEDVRATPWVAADEAYVVLTVSEDHAEGRPRVAKIGSQPLFLTPAPRLPIGPLPWPPRQPNLAIVMELGELDRLVGELEVADTASN